MLDKYLIEHCSPTLASLKTANLFSLSYENKEELKDNIEKQNGELNKKGIILSLISVKDDLALVYVYRRNRLENDLNKEGVFDFLKKYGYESNTPEYAINRLTERLKSSSGFPHEIGLFLGYPLDDVKGFINNGGQNSKCTGCWKVYCNECEAVKIFAKFNKCKEIYSRLFQRGSSVSKLTVSI